MQQWKTLLMRYDYISPLGKDYSNYNILQLVRNSTLVSYQEKEDLAVSDLFLAGDSFSINRYNKQFVKGTKFNNGSVISWEFSITSITTKNGVSTATISITKA